MKQTSLKTVVVIGGGASGFFSAINIAMRFNNYKVIILEKTSKLLSKVKISGGGRCNVTHQINNNKNLITHYPRGQKELQSVFSQFTTTDIIEWFKNRNISLHTESDGRMFPTTNSSDTIINCFLQEADKLQIKIMTNEAVLALNKKQTQFEIITTTQHLKADYVICSIGGHSKLNHYEFLNHCGHKVKETYPSLFSFNINYKKINELMGLSVLNAKIAIQNSKLNLHGPLLITHWGLSGPVILKLSAWAALELNKLQYHTNIIVNWTGDKNENDVLENLEIIKNNNSLLSNQTICNFPNRLWLYFIDRANISLQIKCNELSKKSIIHLAQIITKDTYEVHGKTTYKEEFVTAGGVNLKEINMKTMESKLTPNLFFCGEVLNIDGVTGGFNFQNAWSTSWIASKLGWDEK